MIVYCTIFRLPWSWTHVLQKSRELLCSRLPGMVKWDAQQLQSRSGGENVSYGLTPIHNSLFSTCVCCVGERTHQVIRVSIRRTAIINFNYARMPAAYIVVIIYNVCTMQYIAMKPHDKKILGAVWYGDIAAGKTAMVHFTCSLELGPFINLAKSKSEDNVDWSSRFRDMLVVKVMPLSWVTIIVVDNLKQLMSHKHLYIVFCTCKKKKKTMNNPITNATSSLDVNDTAKTMLIIKPAGVTALIRTDTNCLPPRFWTAFQWVLVNWHWQWRKNSLWLWKPLEAAN